MRSSDQSPASCAGGLLPGDRTGSRELVSALRCFPFRAAVSAALRLYQWTISPLLPPACRFHPTCSEYTRQAVERYGAARGLWLGLKRLARCHPFHAGGIDPVR